ncbi:MAG: PAS domain-containing sensor histidine kinase [Anaerolineae bacterium]
MAAADLEHYRALFASAPDGYLVTDLHGTIQEANTAASELLSIAACDLPGRPLLTSIAPEDQLRYQEQLRLLSNGSSLRDWDVLLVSPNGKTVPAAVSAVQAKSLSRAPSLRWLLRDATQRHQDAVDHARLLAQIQEERAHAQELASLLEREWDVLQSIMDNTHAHLAYLDTNFCIVRANRACAAGLGRDVDALLGRCLLDWFPDPALHETFRRVRDLGMTHIGHAQQMAVTTGATLWPTYWDWTLMPLSATGGQVSGLVFSRVDVSDNVRAKQISEAQQSRLRTLIAASGRLLAQDSVSGVLDVLADAALSLIGARQCCAVYGGPDGAYDSQVPAGKSPVSHEQIAALTTWLGVQQAGSPNDSVQLYRLRPHDLAREPRLLALLESFPGDAEMQVVPLLSADSSLAGWLALTHGTRESLPEEARDLLVHLAQLASLALQQADLHQQVERHAADLEQRVADRTAALRASEARFRTVFESAAVGIALVATDGTLLACNPALGRILGCSEQELYAKPLTALAPAEEAADLECTFRDLILSHQGSVRCEKHLIRQDGRLICADITLSAAQSSRRRPHLVVVMVSDISEQKQAQQALIQAEKLAVTGRLASSLVHEINNPLQAVIGCLGLAEECLTDGGDVARYLQVAREQLHRTARIVSELHELRPRTTPDEHSPSDVNRLLERVLTLSSKRCRDAGVEVFFTPAEELPPIMVAADRIQQVFLNLVLNAVDAMPSGGSLRVGTRHDEPAGVLASFEDTGHGIPADVLAHIFDPFFTTKPNGLGLGLFISHNIIAEHGGRLEAFSEPGVGTTFHVWLPTGS